jgi:hypothetical protein
MNNDDRFYSIGIVEDYYIARMDELVEQELFDDSNALFEEFVVDGEEPEEWVFLDDLTNVC